ncbi:MAG: hypothetical protein AB7E70_19740 [Hyphomicrobiaceae bacterium]
MTANETSFKRGKSGSAATQFGGPRANPRIDGGKKPGYLKTMHEVVTLNDWREICVQAVKDAKAGDRHARTWVSEYLIGKPKQTIDVNATADAGQLALLEALRMTPHERRSFLDRVDAEDAEELAKPQDATSDDVLAE